MSPGVQNSNTLRDIPHWYTREGEPAHITTAGDGHQRSATVADARERDLLPSVTSVLGVLNKPGLVAWKLTLTARAGILIGRSGEPVPEAAFRATRDLAEKQARQAADCGTRLHAALAALAGGYEPEPSKTPDEAAALTELRHWFTHNVERVLWSEKVLVSNPRGYAGQADLFVVHRQHGLTLIDLKTTTLGTRPERYPEWLYQLSAYWAALAVPAVRCMNVLLDQTGLRAGMELLWGEDEIARGLEAFEAAHHIWRHQKCYDPRRFVPHGLAATA